MKNLSFDPVFDFIESEYLRQKQHIELIASENYVSPAVQKAESSCLTNKYAEGYPGKRYYGGCEYVDEIENLAIERAKQLFGVSYVNVQPHSGSQANAAVYLALLNAGDTILGMGLNDGGHLTHGSKVNASGKLYHAITYGLDAKTGYIDYEKMESLAREHKPKLIIAGFSAYSGIVNWERFRAIADEVGAYLMVDMAHVAGLIAVGLYPSPVPFADVITSTTHKTLRGPRGGIILSNNKDLGKRLNSAIFPGMQGGPLMHIIAAKAIAFQEALQPGFKTYQKAVLENAKKMVEVVKSRGHQVVSGGTENHLFLMDFKKKPFSGKLVEQKLGLANITVNKNSVLNDHRSPFETSGIRIGTPAVTTRGFNHENCAQVAHWICDLLEDMDNNQLIDRIKNEVLELTNSFPIVKHS